MKKLVIAMALAATYGLTFGAHAALSGADKYARIQVAKYAANPINYLATEVMNFYNDHGFYPEANQIQIPLSNSEYISSIAITDDTGVVTLTFQSKATTNASTGSRGPSTIQHNISPILADGTVTLTPVLETAGATSYSATGKNIVTNFTCATNIRGIAQQTTTSNASSAFTNITGIIPGAVAGYLDNCLYAQ